MILMNNTLRNGFRVLELLCATGAPIGVKDVAARLRLPNSHACRLLKSLAATGYVEQDRGRKYRVSVRILILSHMRLCTLEIRSRIRPFLSDLSRRLEQDVYLALNLRGEALIVDVVHARGVARDPALEIGSINAAHATASGKVCAAYASGTELQALLKRRPLKRFTKQTIVDMRAFKRELAKVREERVALLNGEQSLDTCAVAVPIFDASGALAAAVGTVLPRGTPTRGQWQQAIAETRHAADAASRALGFTGGI